MENTDLCRHLPWDSEFFGRRIARLMPPTVEAESLQSALAWCQNENVECLYWLTDSGAATVRLAEANGFYLTDVRLTLECRLPAAGLAQSPLTPRPAHLNDVPALRAIAQASHHDSRFYADENFPLEMCNAFYATWIDRSVHGFDEAVFVVEINQQVAGYVTCSLDGSDGRIGLLAIAAAAQGQGAGMMLVGHAVAWLAAQGARRVAVVTQARNCAAQRLYQRCGFLTSEVRLWYHQWFPVNESS